MIPLTIAVAVIAVALALWVKPPTALGILICSMMLYPDYLRIPIGPMKMSVPRLVALALLFRLASTARQRGFRWRFIDKLICFEWLWSMTANLLAGAEQMTMNETIGRVFDTVLMYFVARLCLVRVTDYRKLVRPVVACAIIAGVLGISEAITHFSPYQFLRSYSAIVTMDLGTQEGPAEYRFGFSRAQVATSTCLYFGMAMVALLGIVYAGRGFVTRKWMWILGCAVALLGSISSMSSGPQSALIVFTVISFFFYFPRLIKPALGAFAGLIFFGELASNRHFWYWIEYLNPAGGDSWYRSQLITIAIAQWRDYWILGVGGHGVNHWGALIDGRGFADIVNEYVLVALYSGLLGLACRLGIQIAAIRDAIWMYRHGDFRTKQLAFGLAATLIAFMVGGLSVGSFGPPLLLIYLLMGLMVRRAADETPLTRRAPVRTSSSSRREMRGAGSGSPQLRSARDPRASRPV